MVDEHDRVALNDLGEFAKAEDSSIERLKETGKLALNARDTLVLNELRRVLQRQAERDIIIEELRGIIDTLAVGHVVMVEEIEKIRGAYVVLLAQQQELRQKQESIAEVCDAYAEKMERLTEEVADRD
jgi:hypothetical protein